MVYQLDRTLESYATNIGSGFKAQWVHFFIEIG